MSTWMQLLEGLGAVDEVRLQAARVSGREQG